MVASLQHERRPKLGYFKNEVIEDWSPTPLPRSSGIHVTLQTRRRDMRRKTRDYTAVMIIGSWVFFVGVGLFFGSML